MTLRTFLLILAAGNGACLALDMMTGSIGYGLFHGLIAAGTIWAAVEDDNDNDPYAY